MILYDSNILIIAKLDCIILGNSWRWPSAVSHQIIELSDNFPTRSSPNGDEEKKAMWSIENFGNCPIKSNWNLWRNKKPKVEWGNLIWFPRHIPRFSTII